MDNFNTSPLTSTKTSAPGTKGEIYLGVIGAVPGSGKSTFIKRFMEQMVLPYMNDELTGRGPLMRCRSQRQERRS